MLLIDSLVELLSTVALGVIGAALVWHVVDAVRTDRGQDVEPGRGRDRGRGPDGDRVTTRSR